MYRHLNGSPYLSLPLHHTTQPVILHTFSRLPVQPGRHSRQDATLPLQILIQAQRSQTLGVSPAFPPQRRKRHDLERDDLAFVSQPGSPRLQFLEIPPAHALLQEHQREELVAAAGAGIHRGLHAFRECGLLVGRNCGGPLVDVFYSGFGHVEEVGAVDDEADLLLDLLAGFAAEVAAVVEHAGGELGEGQGAGGDARLDGEDGEELGGLRFLGWVLLRLFCVVGLDDDLGLLVTDIPMQRDI
jgi:hypothetical protein